MLKLYSSIKSCRSCGSTHLLKVMSLGRQSVISFPDNPKERVPSGPLELVLCKKCKLLQLRHTFERNILYRSYWYESGINPTMIAALKDIVDSASKIVKLKKRNIVMDIASNDNTLLKQYTQKGIIKVGIDPSDVAKQNMQKGIISINNFFSVAAFKQALRQMDEEKKDHESKASIVTCIAMFYDLPDPNVFLEDVKKCMKEDGIFIIQMNYLGLMYFKK